MSQTRWALFAVAAGGVGEYVRRRRLPDKPAPAAEAPAEARELPPLTTQSSPGQIADLQQAYGAEMAPLQAPTPAAADEKR